MLSGTAALLGLNLGQAKDKILVFLSDTKEKVMSFPSVFSTTPVQDNEASKGQLNSEWMYEVIVSPKMPTKN